MQDELSDMFKTFIYNIQCKINNQEIENLSDINNPAIVKHKGRPYSCLPKLLSKSIAKFRHNILYDFNIVSAEFRQFRQLLR